MQYQKSVANSQRGISICRDGGRWKKERNEGRKEGKKGDGDGDRGREREREREKDRERWHGGVVLYFQSAYFISIMNHEYEQRGTCFLSRLVYVCRYLTIPT